MRLRNPETNLPPHEEFHAKHFLEEALSLNKSMGVFHIELKVLNIKIDPLL